LYINKLLFVKNEQRKGNNTINFKFWQFLNVIDWTSWSEMMRPAQ